MSSHAWPADMHKHIQDMLSDVQFHLKECIDVEIRERRRAVAELGFELRSALECSRKDVKDLRKELQLSQEQLRISSPVAPATPELPAPTADCHGEDKVTLLRAVREDMSEHAAASEQRLRHLETRLEEESVARKSIIAEMQRFVLEEIAQELPQTGNSKPRPPSEDVAEGVTVYAPRPSRAMCSLSGLNRRSLPDFQSQCANAPCDVQAQKAASGESPLSQPQQQQPKPLQKQPQRPQHEQEQPDLGRGRSSTSGSTQSNVTPEASHMTSEVSHMTPEISHQKTILSTFSFQTIFGSRPGLQVAAGCELEVDLSLEYTFDRSTWDASLFFGLYPVSFCDSIILAFAFLTAAAVQVLFVCIIFSSLIPDPLTTPKLQELMTWRLSEAHSVDNYDPQSHTSLATRVCDRAFDLSIAEQQNRLHSTVADFLAAQPLDFLGAWKDGAPSILSGRSLCLLCIALWTLEILRELQKATQFGSMLWKYRRPGMTSMALVDGGIKLRHVNQTRVFVLLMVCVVPRMAIAAVLFVAGTEFLLYTVDLTDLLLNALALAFIIQVDDLLNEILVPSIVKSIQSKMIPVKLLTLSKKVVKYRQVDKLAILSIVLLISIMVLVRFRFHDPFMVRVETARSILCDGSLNFVYTLNKVTGVIHVHNTASERVFSNQNYFQAALIGKTNLAAFLNDDMRKILEMPRASIPLNVYFEERDGIDKVVTLSAMSPAEISNSYLCRDKDSNAKEMLTVAAVFSFQELKIRTCDDLKPFCFGEHSLTARSLCPETCGCFESETGRFDFTGCSTKCMSVREDTIISLMSKYGSCCSGPQDLSASELSSVAGWANYFSNLNAFLHEKGVLDRTLRALGVTNLTDAAITEGCALVPAVKDNTDYDPCCVRGCDFGSVSMWCAHTCDLSQECRRLNIASGGWEQLCNLSSVDLSSDLPSSGDGSRQQTGARSRSDLPSSGDGSRQQTGARNREQR